MASYSLSDPTVQIWHERMGHLGEAGLKKLENIATDIDLKRPYKNTCICEVCVYGRIKENPHKRLIKPENHAMNLIHIDLCGPFLSRGRPRMPGSNPIGHNPPWHT